MNDEGESGSPPTESRHRRQRLFTPETRARLAAAAEERARQEEVARRRIIQQVLACARRLDLVVDDCEVTADPKLRQDLLEEGLSASIDGLDVVTGERFVQDPRGYVADVKKLAGWDIATGLGALRGDPASLRTFLSAESRILTDLGLPPSAVARTRSVMAYVIVEWRTTTSELGGQVSVSELRDELIQDRERLPGPAGHHKIWRRLTGVLEAFGGVLVIVGDQLIGGVTAPVTAGLSVYGAILSQAVGAEVLMEGVRRARREEAQEPAPSLVRRTRSERNDRKARGR